MPTEGKKYTCGKDRNRMKVLILTCSAGGGHNSAAWAVEEECGRRGIDYEVKEALMFAGKKASHVINQAYITMVIRCPWMFTGIYRLGDKIGKITRWKSPVYRANSLYARHLYRYIADNKFTAVVVTHLFPGQAMTYINRQGRRHIPFYYVSTDYTCIPFIDEVEPDVMFVPHKDLVADCMALGIPEEILQPAGIPVSDAFEHPVSKEKAREKLGIPRDAEMYMVMTGSMGYGKVAELTRLLYRKMHGRQVICILAGNNKKLAEALENQFSQIREVKVLGYTNQVALYMAAADLLFTKPGGLSSTEAVTINIPTVLTPPIPGCETANADFFSRHRMVYYGHTNEECVELAEELMRNPRKRQEMLECQRREMPPGAAARIVDCICARAQDRNLQ